MCEGGIAFRDRYNRLFELSLLKEETIFGMFSLGWGIEHDAWRWRRRLFAWEEELVGELRLLLHNVSLQVDWVDRRVWRLETSSVYTVRSAYNFCLLLLTLIMWCMCLLCGTRTFL